MKPGRVLPDDPDADSCCQADSATGGLDRSRHRYAAATRQPEILLELLFEYGQTRMMIV